jgi:enoyl-[acyl-carrier protein] reductase/trans-2-enoyl-CoA reductase (NAD+)
VDRQIDAARAAGTDSEGGRLLVVGSSTGYGLASRIAGAFGHGMDSVGVSFERPSDGRRTASAGWYNTGAFQRRAHTAGLHASDLIGDAFSTEVLDATLDHVEATLGKVDRLVYSIAAPRRVDPETGAIHESVLRTVGEPFRMKTVDLRTEEVTEAVIEAATAEELAGTVAVMGGGDMRRWVTALLERGLLEDGARAVTFSYIGPEVTWPIYKQGTIGHAKADLESANREMDALLGATVGGGSNVSINKSVVTQASSAIPGVPLYMSLLFKVMKGMGLHEGTIEQMVRLFGDHFALGRTPVLDAEARIRLDDLEMRPDVQEATMARWDRVTTENLREVADWAGYHDDFRALFGFTADTDTAHPVEIEVDIPTLVTGFGGV